MFRARVVGVARDRSGAAAVEFALIGPFLLVMLFGIVQFGLALNNYLMLTDAVRAGGRAFAISRSTTTPFTTATGAVTSAAPNLASGSVSMTLKINGTACASDSTCQTALTNAAGGSASVSATYPCNLDVMGVDFAPSCTLSSQTTELIE